MATDEEIVEQIDRVKTEMFKLEEMLGPPYEARRATLFPIRAEFCQVAFRLIGRRGK